MIILFITLALLSVLYKYDNCSKCNFKINNSNIDAYQLMNLYSDKCLKSNVSNFNSIPNQDFSRFFNSTSPAES